MSHNKLPFREQSLHCRRNGESILPAIHHFSLRGTPLRKIDGRYYAPCPWAGGCTCPTGGTVMIHPKTGTFRCPLCAPHGGDTVTYHQTASRLTYAQALDWLTIPEEV